MKKHVRCTWCRSLKTQRWGKRKTSTGSVQKFRCSNCSHIFSKRLTKGRLTAHKKVEVTRSHLEGRTSIRTLVRETGLAKQTISNAIYDTVSTCVSTAAIASVLQPNWSGYLAVDGSAIRVWDWSAKGFYYTKEQKRFLHKLVWLVALDLKTLDIVHHHLGDEETMIDLVLFYQQVKANGYPLKGLVSDGNTDVVRSARMVFGQTFAHQLYVRHYVQNLRVRLKDRFITEKQYEVWKRAIYSGKPLPGLPKELFTYQSVPDLPRTNQQIENLFRQSRLRTRSIGQFHSQQTAYDYLNAWTLFRRFTPFTDCRDKSKNHHAPLQLAGCDISSLDYLQLQKTNLFLGR